MQRQSLARCLWYIGAVWEYIKKVIEHIIFSLLLEGVIVVGRLSSEGIIDSLEEVMKIAACVAPAVLAGMAVLSLVKVQKRRKNGRYERDPISTGALVTLAVVAVVGVIGVAIGVNILAGYLYNL